MLRRVAIILGYLALSCLIVALTIGLVAYGNGYTYNFSQHRIVRTGIVIIQSSPGGVPVSLDGHTPKKKTTYRQSFEAGSYTFSIVRTGFHTWQKTLKVLAGDVTLVQYVVLVPNNLSPHQELTAAVVSQSLSQDHRHVAYITGGADPAVFVDDVGSGSPVKVYTPATASDNAPAEVLGSVAWSDDASHLLVTTQLGGATIARVMAANGSGVQNLTDQFHFDFATLRFSSSNWRQLYWLSPEGLRRLDLDNQTVSAVLADQVRQFEVTTDRILFVQATSLGESLWSLDGRGRKQELVNALPASDHYSLAYTAYQGVSYLGVVPAGTGAGTLYTNIYGDNPVAQIVAHTVVNVSFSPDGHLVNFSGPTTETTYDLDQSTVFGTRVAYTFGATSLIGSTVWFDNFHLLSNQNGRLIWSEFDGANAVDLGSVAGALPGFGSTDTKSVYFYTPGVNSAVRLMQLVIKP